jgi:hypothetical protein
MSQLYPLINPAKQNGNWKISNGKRAMKTNPDLPHPPDRQVLHPFSV